MLPILLAFVYTERTRISNLLRFYSSHSFLFLCITRKKSRYRVHLEEGKVFLLHYLHPNIQETDEKK